jgi:hypothetical protein
VVVNAEWREPWYDGRIRNWVLNAGTFDLSTVARPIPIPPTIVTGTAQPMAAGQVGRVPVTVTAAPGRTLRAWSAGASSESLAGGSLCPTGTNCPTQSKLEVAVRNLFPGRHVLTVDATDDLGTQSTIHVPIEIFEPSLTRLDAPAVTKRGGTFVLHGRVESGFYRGFEISAAQVTLQRRYDNNSQWTDVKRGRTLADGTVKFTQRARRNAQWRLITGGSPGGYRGSSSPPVRVAVRPKLSLQVRSLATAGGSRMTLTARGPSERGAMVIFETRRPQGPWAKIATVKINRAGVASTTWTAKTRGRWQVRVTRAASPFFLPAVDRQFLEVR